MKNEIPHSRALEFLLAGRCTATIFTDEPKHRSLDHITIRITNYTKYIKWYVWYGNERVAYIHTTAAEFVTVLMIENFITDAHKIAAKSVEFVIRRLQQETLPEKVHILHEGLCGKCGRTLTDPTSIEIGFGPTCRGEK